jgi:hypothetical protein
MRTFALRATKIRLLMFFVVPFVALSVWLFKDVRYSHYKSNGFEERAVGGSMFGFSYVVSDSPWYSPTESFRYVKVQTHLTFYRVILIDSLNRRIPIIEFHPKAILGDSPLLQ